MQTVVANSPLVEFTRGALGIGALCATFGAAASGISAVAGHFFPDISMALNLGVGAATSGFIGFVIFSRLVIDGCPGYYNEDGFVEVAHRDLTDHNLMLGSVASGAIASTGAFALSALAVYKFG